jgi:quercetin 2,3-dioxygenase
MLTESQAQIYLSDRRGIFQCEGFRSFRTLNFAEYHAPGREAVESLIAFNDETLAAEEMVILTTPVRCSIALIPLVGGLEIQSENEEPEYVSAGEVFCFDADPETDYRITNPFPDHAVNYLQLRFAYSEKHRKPTLGAFDIEDKNKLIPISSELGIYIGTYNGREEDAFIPENPARPIFTFIIEGAFEVQNRLLEKRDALTVWNAAELEFEALSQGAIILVVNC